MSIDITCPKCGYVNQEGGSSKPSHCKLCGFNFSYSDKFPSEEEVLFEIPISMWISNHYGPILITGERFIAFEEARIFNVYLAYSITKLIAMNLIERSLEGIYRLKDQAITVNKPLKQIASKLVDYPKTKRSLYYLEASQVKIEKRKIKLGKAWFYATHVGIKTKGLIGHPTINHMFYLLDDNQTLEIIKNIPFLSNVNIVQG